jgi:uncharacterized membrane protein
MKIAIPHWLNAVALVGLFFIWAIAAHLGSAGLGNVDLNAAIALAPIVVFVALLFKTLCRPTWVVAVVCVLLAFLWLYWTHLTSQVAGLYYLQHLGTHLAMALFFGKTLRHNQVPLITQLAKRIEVDQLSVLKLTYTRWVTIAWTAFFCINALVSTVLFVAASSVVWSFHANLMTGPLVVLMFLGEFLFRLRVLPAHERPSIIETIRAYRQATQGAAVTNPLEPKV